MNQPAKVLLKTPWSAVFFLFCFAGLFYLQKKLAAIISLKKALIILALVGIVYFISMPFFSSDVLLYTFKGKIQVEKNLDPYQFVPFFETPYRYLSPWVFFPLAYGPVTHLVFKLFYFPALSPFMNMYILKAVFLAFFAVILGVVFRRLRYKNNQEMVSNGSGGSRGAPQAESPKAGISRESLIFFMLSPLLLIENVMCGHLEMMPLAFFIFSLLALKKKRFLAFFFLGLACTFKLNYGIFLLPLFIESIKDNWGRLFSLAMLKQTASEMTSFLFPIGITLLLYPDPRKYIASFKRTASLDNISILKLFDTLPLGKYLLIILAIAAFIYFSRAYIKGQIDIYRFTTSFFLIFLLFNKVLQPWHIFPLYGLYIFLKPQKFDYLGLAVLCMYPVYFLFYNWNTTQSLISTFIIFLGIASMIFLEIWGLTKQKTSQTAKS